MKRVKDDEEILDNIREYEEIFLANSKKVDSQDINEMSDLKKPIEKLPSHFYCGWFLQYFHEIFVLNESKEKVTGMIVANNKIFDKELIESISETIKSLKGKFNKFISKFWNHIGFQI